MKETAKYFHDESIHNFKAPNIIVPHLVKLFQPKAVADVGCGLGNFLHVFRQNGVQDVLGIDGSWVKESQLVIPREFFLTKDLEQEFNVGKQFDLVLCLEVAEHLSEKAADVLIENLTRLGKKIIFSAAVINQGGQNHINEQNFDYWQEKFAKKGYAFYDVFRNVFWEEKDINWWYKQNMFLVASNDTVLPEETRKHKIEGMAHVYLHPELLQSKLDYMSETRILDTIQSGGYPLRTYLKGIWKKGTRFLAGKSRS